MTAHRGNVRRAKRLMAQAVAGDVAEYEVKVAVTVRNSDRQHAESRARFIAEAMEDAANAMDADLQETTIEELS